MRVPGNGGVRTRPNLIVHRHAPDPRATTKLNIPVTSPGITIIDIAPQLSLAEIDAAVAEADKQDAAAGQERLRFSHWQVKFEPGRVVEICAAVAARPRADRRRVA